MRMCVACREMRAKKDLMRVVRTEDGLKLDRTGKLSGRGAYLCRDAACMEKAVRTRALERALEAPMNDELKAALLSEIGHGDESAV
ncbi:MAG: YlxR family protein [Clostridia bacterium]|nr:YlxR family protein [Clostridia bacterium]